MNAPIRREDENGEPLHWRSRMYDWLFSQGVSTVLLFAILIAVGYLGNYALTTAVPAHLKTIQDGYREIQAENKVQQKELLERFKDDRTRDREWASMEREKDRLEWVRAINRKADKAPEKE